MTILILVVYSILGLAMSGCTFKATLDTTTDGTTEFVSSTTGKTWWSEDGLVKQGRHAEAFVSINYDNLLQDIAKREGEYLLALGNLLQVPAGLQPAFADQLQQQYVDLSRIHVHESAVHVKQFLHHVIGVMANLLSVNRKNPTSSQLLST